MPHLYGPVPEGPTRGKIGVIVASEPRGPLANLIYCSTGQPLVMIPRYLYRPLLPKFPSAGQGRSFLRQPLAIGDQVEFDLDENRCNTVLWMMKSPNYLPIDCSSGGSPRMEVIAAVTTIDDDIGGLGLWSSRYKYIEATDAQLRNQPLGVPLWCCIEIVISYGEYEGATSVPLHRNFKPFYWFRLVDYIDKTVDPIEGVEFLKKAPCVTAILENCVCEGNRDDSNYTLLETFFDRAARSMEANTTRAGGVRKKSNNQEERKVPTEADTGSGEQNGGEDEADGTDDRLDKELTAWMKRVLSIG